MTFLCEDHNYCMNGFVVLSSLHIAYLNIELDISAWCGDFVD